MSPALWSINGRFLAQPQTGVQRYAGETTRAIDARLARDASLSDRLRVEVIVPADCGAVPAYDAVAVRRAPTGRGHAFEQVVLPAMARGGLLSFANLGPLAHVRQIVCMHDANVFLEPASYAPAFRAAYRAGLPLLARRARAVTTVSAFSAAMLARHGVLGRRGCTVVHNGHEHALRWRAAASPLSEPGRFPRPFVFALGSRARHKRLDLLLGLAPALDALGIDLVLSGGAAAIFAGAATGPAVGQGAGQAAGRGARNVHQLGFVGDDDLAALFGRALCFAFPSRTEGFGLPLLEAMVHGAPIVAAAAASMPEVCGDAALYASPEDAGAWLDRIARLAADATLRADLAARGRARYPRFSWHAGADAYLALALRLSAVQARPARSLSAPGGASAADG